MSKYNKIMVLLICIFLGYIGMHHFYVKRNAMGWVYLFTLGLFGIGWIIDIILICINKFKDGDGFYVTSQSNSNVSSVSTYSTPTVNIVQSSNVPQNIKPNSYNKPNNETSDNKPSIDIPADSTPTVNTVQNSYNKLNNEMSDSKPSIDIPKEIDGQPLKYKYFDVKICVISGQEPDYSNIIERLKVVPVVTTLELETDNEYDNQAVKVMDGQNKLGYLYKGKLKDMVYDYLTKNRPIFSCLSTMDLDTYEMKMFIGLYYLKPYSMSTTFKLTANTNSEMQDELMCCSVGSELTFRYDYDKEKYCFTNFGDIGYAPKSKNELLEQIEYDCRATVEEIDTNDNGKYYVVVKVEYDS